MNNVQMFDFNVQNCDNCVEFGPKSFNWLVKCTMKYILSLFIITRQLAPTIITTIYYVLAKDNTATCFDH